MKVGTILSVAVVLMMLLTSLPAVAAEDSGTDDPLPSSFDQRDLGIVTPPKFQDPMGTCWVFCFAGATETAILSYSGRTYEETGLDLSVLHAAFFANGYVREDTSKEQAGEGIHFLSDDPNAFALLGGYGESIAQLFATGGGPVYEYVHPYKNRESISYLDKLAEDGWFDGYFDTEFFIPRFGEPIEEAVDEGDQEMRSKVFGYYDTVVSFPEGVDEYNYTSRDLIDAAYDVVYDYYSANNQYFRDADWTLDQDERNVTIGYMIEDFACLPLPWTADGDNGWTGLDYDGIATIKEELMNGRGVTLCYDMTAENEFGTFYTAEQEDANHAVQLVGWDDGFPSEKFSYVDEEGNAVQPEGDGAWLIKNSYGSETFGYEVNGVTYYSDAGYVDENGKHTGYYWLSYYDRTMTSFFSVSVTDRVSGDQGYVLYCHDYLPNLAKEFKSSGTVMKTANMFVGETDDPLSFLSIQTHGDSDIRVKIYLDPKRDDPESGHLVYDRTLSYDLMGCHTIELPKPVRMYEGRVFSIVVEEHSDELGYIVMPNSVVNESEAIGGLYGVAVVNEGESFLYKDGKWTDWYYAVEDLELDPMYVYDNFWIKAYATINEDKEDGNNLMYDAMIVLILIGTAALLLRIRR